MPAVPQDRRGSGRGGVTAGTHRALRTPGLPLGPALPLPTRRQPTLPPQQIKSFRISAFLPSHRSASHSQRAARRSESIPPGWRESGSAGMTGGAREADPCEIPSAPCPGQPAGSWWSGTHRTTRRGLLPLGSSPGAHSRLSPGAERLPRCLHAATEGQRRESPRWLSRLPQRHRASLM